MVGGVTEVTTLTVKQIKVPLLGEVSAFRSPRDGALVVEVDTVDALLGRGRRPAIRVYVNDELVRSDG